MEPLKGGYLVTFATKALIMKQLLDTQVTLKLTLRLPLVTQTEKIDTYC